MPRMCAHPGHSHARAVQACPATMPRQSADAAWSTAQSQLPEQGANGAVVRVRVVVPSVSPAALAVTVMAPAPVARTRAYAIPWYAFRTLPRKLSCTGRPLSTATITPGPLTLKVTAAEELVTTRPAESAMVAFTYEMSLMSVDTAAWSDVSSTRLAVVPVGGGDVRGAPQVACQAYPIERTVPVVQSQVLVPISVNSPEGLRTWRFSGGFERAEVRGLAVVGQADVDALVDQGAVGR